MKRLCTFLFLAVVFAIPSFADTISGTVSTNTGINVTTPEGVTLSMPSAGYMWPLSFDPASGGFSFHFEVTEIPGWSDMFCNPSNFSHCNGVDMLGNLSGTLSSLPTYNGSYWVVPSQSLTLHSAADISYWYMLPDGTSVDNTVHNVPTQFLFALNTFAYYPGGALDFGRLNLDATFPDPAVTPEPASMLLILAGGGLVWNLKLRRS